MTEKKKIGVEDERATKRFMSWREQTCILFNASTQYFSNAQGS